MATSEKCWRYYSSGILSKANSCATEINHAVTIVGVHIAETDSFGPDTESDSSDDEEEKKKKKKVTKCKRASWKEKIKR